MKKTVCLMVALAFVMTVFSYADDGKELQDLKEKLKKDPNNVQLLCDLANTCFEMGEVATNKDEQIKILSQGRDYAKKAKTLDPKSADAHYLYGANLGTVGKLKGFFNMLWSVPELKEEFDKVLELDPNHYKGLIARGNLYYELPGVLGGDLDKSVKDLKTAIELKPNSSRAHLDLGRVYVKRREYAKAREMLNKVVNMQNPLTPKDQPRYMEQAQKLLKEIAGK
jgi:tetratricopeptide (TPR) repeat protein